MGGHDLDMLPRFSHTDMPNGCVRNAVVNADGVVGVAVTNTSTDHGDVSLGQSRSSIGRASMVNQTDRVGVLRVLQAGNVFKILNAIVGFVAVLVVYFVTFRWFARPRSHQQDMDKVLPSPSLRVGQVNDHIAGSVTNRLQVTVGRVVVHLLHATHFPRLRNRVSAFVARNGFEFLRIDALNHVTSVAETGDD